MTFDIRQATDPARVKRFDTHELRQHFLIERLFALDEVVLTYSHIDRLVVGGVMPGRDRLTLPIPKTFGTAAFLERRELGVINIGGAGRVHIGDTVHALERRDCLYIGRSAAEVGFESADHNDPAKFYLVSTPAHATYETVKIPVHQAKRVDLGEQSTSNKRTIYQYIIPGVCQSCQLVMGLTQLEPGSMWNTMPCHVHDRRSEVYVYFDLNDAARVMHFMGEPGETRHLVVANEQAVLSPSWSIHSGVGTHHYTFIWAMAGENQDYTDMDPVAMADLR